MKPFFGPGTRELTYSRMSGTESSWPRMNDECESSPKEGGQAFPDGCLRQCHGAPTLLQTLRRRISSIELAAEFHRKFNRMAKGGAETDFFAW
jgi:hypothetical protein